MLQDKNEDLISVIIINYKTPLLTTSCIESIFQYTQWVKFEVILLDNGSWDESKKYFQKHLPETNSLKIIYSLRNLWFGWGNNLWYANSTWSYLFFLNSDTILFEDSLTLLYQEHKRIAKKQPLGLLWPRHYSNIEKSKIEIVWSKLPTRWTLFIETTPYLRNIWKKTYKDFMEEDTRQRDYTKQQWVLCGAAIFCKKEFFASIWLFDEQFFMYTEEKDLAIRSKENWFVSYYTVSTSIIHFQNQSPKTQRRKKYIFLQSFLKFIWKHKKYLFLSHR